ASSAPGANATASRAAERVVARFPSCVIFDWIRDPRGLHSFPTRRSSDLVRGAIEGFYGPPWSHEDRLSQPELYGEHKMNAYIYRSEEHTSELQSRENLVCRLLLEKKNRSPRLPSFRVPRRPPKQQAHLFP